jgi:hypothetical protein
MAVPDSIEKMRELHTVDTSAVVWSATSRRLTSDHCYQTVPGAALPLLPPSTPLPPLQKQWMCPVLDL